MSDQYVGEIRMFAGNFAPKGWALCNGQLMAISQNTALFSLLGVMYGGDGKVTFALPNLQGSAPMQWGTGPGLTPRYQGESGGSSTVTLLTNEMPGHNHVPQANSGTGTFGTTQGNVWGQTGRSAPAPYAAGPVDTPMSPMALGAAGGSQPHNNMQPYLGINFIIALEGIYPPRS